MAICIEVRKLRVRSLDVDFHEVTWEIAPLATSAPSVDVFDYTFTVLRSGGPEGPYEAISPAMDDQFVFVDNNIKRFDNYREYFYKILLTEKSTGGTREFGPVRLTPDPDLVALELRKHMNLLFREFIGRRCWVLPLRTFGQRCQCFNETLQKQIRSGCRTCYDTGYVRGYFSPIEVWISIDPPPKDKQQTNIGELQQQNTTARVGYWPPLKPGDVLVEPENIRWRVNQVSQTEQVRAVVHQEIQMHRIPRSDIEYAIRFDLGDVEFKDVFLSPARNFTNPHNLENFMDEEIPRILSIYPSTYPKVPT